MIRLKGYPFLANKEEYPANTDYEARDAMTTMRELAVISASGNTLGSLDQLLQETDFKGYPVVQDLTGLIVIGYIGRTELRYALGTARDFKL
jgi:chloride channel 3/4/5